MSDYYEIREQVKEEYRRIAFSPIGADIKVSDKLRALDAYISLCADTEGVESGLPPVIKVEYV